MQEIRHQQQGVCRRQQFRVVTLHGEQLVERVQFHELQAGFCENLGAWHAAKGLLQHPPRAGIAIMPVHPQQLAPRVEQNVIDAPSIDTNGDNGFAEFLRGQAKAGLNFPPETEHIPAQRIGNNHAAVGKTVNFFEPEAAAIPDSRHHAAAFRPQVNTEEYL